MTVGPHKLSLDELDLIIDQVRVETMSMLARREASASGASAAPGAVANLDIATLNVSEFLPLPLGLYPGGREMDEGTPVPEVLYAEGKSWKIKKIFYSSGVCEVRASLGGLPKKKQANSLPSLTTGEDSEQKSEQRFQSSIQRSCTTLRARVSEQGSDHLITLTKRGKFISVDQAWKAWDRFSRLVKLRFPKWTAVVVPELHADNETYHMHVAVRGFYSVEALRICWYKALGGKGNERGEHTPGSINIRAFRGGRKGGSGAATVRRIASYIAKYIGKGFTACNRGRRLFASSRELAPHRTERWRVDFRGSPAALAFALVGGLVGAGSSGLADYFRWARFRRDGSLMMTGFVLSTDWSGVTQ